jgi:hypothetical protein
MDLYLTFGVLILENIIIQRECVDGLFSIFVVYYMYMVDRGSSVGITTELRPERSGDRIPVEAIFSAPVQTGPGVDSTSYTKGTSSFPEVERPGRGIAHPPTSIGKLKKE